MGRMIGIDLGTTNSVAAIMDGPLPRVVENREAKTQTRSVVGLRRRRGTKAGDTATELLVGDAALDNWPLAPRDTIVSVKRLMGRAVNDPEVARVRTWALYEVVQPSRGTHDSVRVLIGGREYSPVDVSAMILTKIKEDTEFRLGEPVTHAVITVPAYFTHMQRDATRKAGLLAGLKVIKILDEPTAAAIAFGMQSSDPTPRTVLVFDLGGGTFDISVLMCAGNVFAPLNLEGDMWLGGDNFDDAIVDHATHVIEHEFGIDARLNLRFMAELKRSAQAVKERLSAAESADLIVTGLLQDADGNLVDLDLEISRVEFERMILPLVGRYRQCSGGHPSHVHETACPACGEALEGRPVHEGRALRLTRKALAHPSVNLTPDQIDQVLMAGNSTTVPLVQRTIEEVFGAGKLVRKNHPKHSVALGAAMVAAWMGHQCVCHAPDCDDPSRECGHVNPDEVTRCVRCGAALVLESQGASTSRSRAGSVGGIAPLNYGTQSAGDTFTVFVRKGDAFPTESPLSQIFRTRIPRQRMVSIPIYGGEVLDRASTNQKQGEAFAVLPPGLPQGTAVRVKLWLDRDGVFTLSASLDDGTDLRPWVVKGEEDARAIEAIERVDKALVATEAPLTPAILARVDQARNRVFDKLRQHDFDGAYRDAEQARVQVESAASAHKPESAEAAARGLLRWTEFVLQHYEWSYDSLTASRLHGLVDDLRGAIASDDTAGISRAYRALDDATSRIPAVVDTMLRMRHAIASRVRPGDPGRAAVLLTRVAQIEKAWAAGTPSARQESSALGREIEAAIEMVARATGLQCSNGHAVPKGERHCPACREDTWSLASGATGASHRDAGL